MLVPKQGLRATVLASGAVVPSYDLDTVATERLAAFPAAEREVVQKMLGATNRWELTAADAAVAPGGDRVMRKSGRDGFDEEEWLDRIR